MKTHRFEIRLEDAFMPMPSEVSEKIERAFERGEEAMKQRYKIMSMLSVAAVISVFFAVAALAVTGINAPKPDKVTLSSAMSKQQMEPASTFAKHPETETIEIGEQDARDYSEASFYDGEFSDPKALYVLLSNAYWTRAHENDLEMDSRAVFDAASELGNIFMNNDGDVSQMSRRIRECLQNVLGFEADFIARHYLVNDVLNCLYGSTGSLLESSYQEEPALLKSEQDDETVFEQNREITASGN